MADASSRGPNINRSHCKCAGMIADKASKVDRLRCLELLIQCKEENCRRLLFQGVCRVICLSPHRSIPCLPLALLGMAGNDVSQATLQPASISVRPMGNTRGRLEGRMREKPGYFYPLSLLWAACPAAVTLPTSSLWFQLLLVDSASRFP